MQLADLQFYGSRDILTKINKIIFGENEDKLMLQGDSVADITERLNSRLTRLEHNLTDNYGYMLTISQIQSMIENTVQTEISKCSHLRDNQPTYVTIKDEDFERLQDMIEVIVRHTVERYLTNVRIRYEGG